MSLDDAMEKLREDADNKWIGVYIGILAVLLAVCGVGGGNAAKDATRANIEASNTWAFFQAKNVRRQSVRLHIDDLELRLADPVTSPPLRAEVERRIRTFKDNEARLTSEPATGEGIEELAKKARELEKERDVALRKDPYFDWSQALIQIAIVLASVYLITRTWWLLLMSFGIGGLGSLLMLNGFTLAVSIPFLG
jgi:Domain of unknown function (DUF4337)